jgi:hypothetical protein
MAIHQEPLIRDYVTLLEFDDGSIAELHEGDIERVASWPASATDMPVQTVDGEPRVLGRTVTGAVLRKARQDIGRAGQAQLFLVLDGEALLGLVPTKLGTVLHTEPLLTSPLIRRHHELEALTGETVSLDDLVLA